MGDGLENIYQAIIALDGLALASRSAAGLTKCALAGAREALPTFCAFQGSSAGNVALTFGARCGVYVAGGTFTANRRFLKSMSILYLL